MNDTTTARRLPMSPAAGAALVVFAAVLGALAAGTLLLHGTLTASTLVTLSGAIFGMGFVLAIFRKAGVAGARITWRTFALAIGVLLLFAAGPFLLSQYAPGNDPAAIAMGLLVTAATLGAGIAAARVEAGARRDAARRDIDGTAGDAAGESAHGRAEVGLSDEPASAEGYSAADALADVAGSRAALADVAVTPPWYHPLIGFSVAVLVLVLGLDIPGAWLLIIEVPVIALMIGVIVAYRRTSGMWFAQPERGTRPWRLWVALMIIVVGALATSVIARFTGLWGLAALASVVSFVAFVWLGRAYDDAFRAELRGGSAPRADRATVPGAGR